MDKRIKTPAGSFSAKETGWRIDNYLTHVNPMSTREAARRCGIPQTTMQMYRRGGMRPSRDAMKKLAAVGLTERYVYGKRADLSVQDDRPDLEKAAFVSWYMALDEDARRDLEATAQLLHGYEP